jgi:predicted DNA binding CopG/RHH family protein
MKKTKKIPKFKNEDEERKFWENADTSVYFDWRQAKKYKFPNLKPSHSTISLRLPLGLLEDLKILANERDVPYQSLMKIFLAERISRERSKIFNK